MNDFSPRADRLFIRPWIFFFSTFYFQPVLHTLKKVLDFRLEELKWTIVKLAEVDIPWLEAATFKTRFILFKVHSEKTFILMWKRQEMAAVNSSALNTNDVSSTVNIHWLNWGAVDHAWCKTFHSYSHFYIKK